MGRESSLGIKELFNLPPLVLKAGTLPQWFCLLCKDYVYLSRQWVVPLSFRIGYTVEDKPSDLSCTHAFIVYVYSFMPAMYPHTM